MLCTVFTDSGLDSGLGSGGAQLPSGAGVGKSTTGISTPSLYDSPIPRMKSYIPVLGSVPKPAEIVCGCGVVLSKADRNEFGGIGEPSVKVIVPERSAVDMVGAARFAVGGPLTTTGARVEFRTVKNAAGVSTSWLKPAVNVPFGSCMLKFPPASRVALASTAVKPGMLVELKTALLERDCISRLETTPVTPDVLTAGRVISWSTSAEEIVTAVESV